MTKRNNYRKLLCICMVLCFIFGSLVNINSVRTVSWTACNHHGQIQCEYDTDSKGVIITDRLLPVQTLEKIDGYHSVRVVRKTSESMEEAVQRIVMAVVVIAVVFLLAVFVLECWIERKERRIHIFEVVRFIHRTDGKKKSCFENRQIIKTGGQVNGSWYKV